MKLMLALLFLTAAVGASETERAEIRFSGNTYEYTFIALLTGSSAAVRAVVTDYDNLRRINDGIIESRVLERYDNGDLKRVLRLKHCILVVCFDMNFVENVHESPGRIVTTVIPTESNFADGTAEWLIEAVDAAHTRISVSARQSPTFWIPPVIGPLMIRHVFLREVKETCANIERIVSAGPPSRA